MSNSIGKDLITFISQTRIIDLGMFIPTYAGNYLRIDMMSIEILVDIVRIPTKVHGTYVDVIS